MNDRTKDSHSDRIPRTETVCTVRSTGFLTEARNSQNESSTWKLVFDHSVRLMKSAAASKSTQRLIAPSMRRT